MMREFVPLLAILALSACGHSPPTHFYTLEPVAPRQAPDLADGPPVSVEKTIMPATLDRLSVVVRTGSEQLEASDSARWAAPLDGMVRVLAEDLRRRLKPERVYLPGDPVPSGPARIVMLNLQTFVVSRDGDVVLDGDWFIQDRRQSVLVMRHAHLTRHVDGRDIGAIVAAQSELLGALSDDMATRLSRG